MKNDLIAHFYVYTKHFTYQNYNIAFRIGLIRMGCNGFETRFPIRATSVNSPLMRISNQYTSSTSDSSKNGLLEELDSCNVSEIKELNRFVNDIETKRAFLNRVDAMDPITRQMLKQRIEHNRTDNRIRTILDMFMYGAGAYSLVMVGSIIMKIEESM
jgi:hypothetical protein